VFILTERGEVIPISRKSFVKREERTDNKLPSVGARLAGAGAGGAAGSMVGPETGGAVVEEIVD